MTQPQNVYCRHWTWPQYYKNWYALWSSAQVTIPWTMLVLSRPKQQYLKNVSILVTISIGDDFNAADWTVMLVTFKMSMAFLRPFKTSESVLNRGRPVEPRSAMVKNRSVRGSKVDWKHCLAELICQNSFRITYFHQEDKVQKCELRVNFKWILRFYMSFKR